MGGPERALGKGDKDTDFSQSGISASTPSTYKPMTVIYIDA